MAEPPLVCVSCEYDLSGLAGNVCPECGTPVIDVEARARAANLLQALRDSSIHSDALLVEWPWECKDLAVIAAGQSIGDVLSDSMIVRRAVSSTKVSELLDRWAVFLRTGVPLPVRRRPRPKLRLFWALALACGVGLGFIFPPLLVVSLLAALMAIAWHNLDAYRPWGWYAVPFPFASEEEYQDAKVAQQQRR